MVNLEQLAYFTLLNTVFSLFKHGMERAEKKQNLYVENWQFISFCIVAFVHS